MSILARSASYGEAIADESFSANGSTAQALTPPASAVSAVVSVSGSDARYRLTGSAPTASIGHLLVIGNQVEVYINDLPTFEIISTSGTDTDVFVTYYGS